MKLRHLVIGVWLAAAVIASMAGVVTATASESPAGDNAAVLRGVVKVVVAPDLVLLADGTMVELPFGTSMGTDGVGARLSAGDEILVVGRRDGGGGTPVKAGGVRVLRKDRGQRVPEGNVVCRGGLPAERSGGFPANALIEATVARTRAVRAKDDGEDELEGTVTRLEDDGFEMQDEDDGVYEVVVTMETEFVGVASLDGIEAGDRVKVKGELDERVMTANRVEREESDDDGGDGGGDDGGDDDGEDDDEDGVEFETTGKITDLVPPDRFAMDDRRTYRVDAETEYDDRVISYSGLMVGQFLEVKATYLGGGDYLVVKVEFEGEDDDGQGYRMYEGSVSEIDTTGLTMSGGISVVFTPSTEFKGDSDFARDIQIGWWVEVVALESSTGDLLALEIRSDDRAPATTDGHDFEPHQALVILLDGADPEPVADRHQATVVGEIGSLAVLMHWDDEIDDTLLAQLDADADVSAVEPNYRFRDPESVRRRYPVIDRSPRGSKYTIQRAVTQTNLAAALAISDGAGTVIALMDSGVDPCQPFLRGHLMSGGLDLVDGDLSPWEVWNGVDEDDDGDLDEAFGHGTFVATIVALAAPAARILPYRVLDSDGGGTAFDIALALADAIDRRVDVINLSLTYHHRSMVVDLLLEEASNRSIVIVAAAGNDGEEHLPFPASDGHVLAVAALDADGQGLADFSNRGDQVMLAAPGEDVYGGLAAGDFGTVSGTSVAAPFAAAGAALLKSLDPAVSPDIIRRLLVESGVPLIVDQGAANGIDLEKAVSRVTP